MEESAEIRADPGSARTAWIRSYAAACGRRVGKALSYVTGEMKECGEGLKGKGAAPRPPPIVPRGNTLPQFSADRTELWLQRLQFCCGDGLVFSGRGCSPWKRAAPVAEHEGQPSRVAHHRAAARRFGTGTLEPVSRNNVCPVGGS